MKIWYILCILFGLMTNLFSEDESLDRLLDTYVQNSDLSKKTRLHNAGNVTVYTRQELEKMQARNLRDIFKTLPLLNYVENRWAITDPIYVSHSMPFNSNSIRIYIDNQEVSTASYGSGLFYLGTIGLGFVDHIEVYTLNPSFEYSTEPARYLIKLYSKVPQRDKGGTFQVSAGTEGFNEQSFQYADTVEDVSFYTYISRLDDKRKPQNSFGIPLSRDQERYFLFSTISTQGHRLQLQAMQHKKDMFMGLSTDGDTKKPYNKADYIHIGYENSVVDNLKLRMVYEHGRVISHFQNNLETFDLSDSDTIFTTDLQYQINQIKNNELMIGAKLRYKKFVVNEMELNGQSFPSVAYDQQIIPSLYFEDHYTVNKNWLVTLGAQMSYVLNNAEVPNDTLWMTRIGIIYSDEYWVFKTFMHRSEFLVEPYLYTTTAQAIVDERIKPEKVKNITQEIQYTKDAYKVAAVLGYSYMENTMITQRGGKVANKENSESMTFVQLEYDYKFDIYHRIMSHFSYTHKRNLYRDEIQKGFDEYKGVIRLFNTFGKVDIYNEMVYNYNTFIQTHYVDYSVGLKYRYSDTLTISVKAENIFDRAREDYFERGRRNLETTKWMTFDPLYLSPIDRKVYFTLEYQF